LKAEFTVYLNPLRNFYLVPLMPHKMFVLAYKNGPLGYLIALPKAVYMLLNHKIRDSRLQLFLLRWVGALAVILGAAIGGFSLLPMFVAAGVFAPGMCFFAFLMWLAAGDIFLKFALEDERFYDLATKTHALSIFVDAGAALPSPSN
jgi:hypothetical protein